MSELPPVIWSTTQCSLSELAIGIDSMLEQEVYGLMLLTCAGNDYQESKINQLLKSCKLPICGGMFPQIIREDKVYTKGAIVIGFRFKPIVKNYTALSSLNSNIDEYIEDQSETIEHYQNFIIIGDAFCSVNEDFIDAFYNYIGSGITVIGGGAGALDFVPRNYIYSNQGLIGDAMQVIAIPHSIQRAVGHGWEILDGPYLVTSANEHHLHSFDYQPAFEVYQKAIKCIAGKKIDIDSFFNIAKYFPLGIAGIGDELVVRDPIQSDGRYLECVGNVPVNSTVYLLKGEQDKMILSARQASESLVNSDSSKTLLIFDCISRSLFMEEEFDQELKAIQQPIPKKHLIGVLCLGEITDTQSGAIRLLNKSTVMGVF